MSITQEQQMQEPADDPESRIYTLLVDKDEITWKDLMFDIINSEGMDPWNLSISKLTEKYIEKIKTLKRLDMKVTGKVVLAATLLLRYKSKRLIGEDLDEFDRLLAANEMSEDEFYDNLDMKRDPSQIPDFEKMKLIPRMPQPRQRKVSIYDLVGALEKALDVKKRRILRTMPQMNIRLPDKKLNIQILIKETYKKILLFFKNGFSRLTFSELTRNVSKEEKIFSFQSMLYLYHERKLDYVQDQHFGEIDITMLDKSALKPSSD